MPAVIRNGIQFYMVSYCSAIKHSFITAKMPATHQDELFDKFRVLLVFIELNLLCFIIISRQKRQQNPAPPQLAPQPQHTLGRANNN